MIFIKSITLEDTDNELIEKAIRHFSLKRHTSLDFQASYSNQHEDEKYFLGLENDNSLKLIRLRTEFERIFPKFIIKFDKQNFGSYKLRYSILSSFVFVLLVAALISDLISSINSGQFYSTNPMILFFATIFITFSFIEYKLTTNRIKKALKRIKSI